MREIQEAIEQRLFAIPQIALGVLLQKKLKQHEVEISVEQAEQLAKEALNGSSHFAIPHSGDTSLEIKITSEESEELVAKIEQFLEHGLEDVFLKVQAEVAPEFLRDLKKRWPAQRRWEADEIGRFRGRLRQRWRRGLEKLHLLVTIARELGGEMNADARSQAAALGPCLVDVVTRMHARSCQIAEEVIVLLECGFANGAMARWRTLHEVFVVAAFISKFGEDCAKAYRDHQAVESKKGSDEYGRIYQRLGYSPIPKREIKRIQSAYDRVIREYGDPFKEPYGWAASFLNSKRPNLSQIELAVGTDHFRGHYRMASHGVHANPKGIFTSLTAIMPVDTLLSGPSNAGLADPGHATARSLTMVSSVLMSLCPTFDHQLGIGVMDLLSNEIGHDLLGAHQRLQRDEKRLRENEAR